MNQAPPVSNNSGCLPWVGLFFVTFFIVFVAPKIPTIIDEGVLIMIWWLCFQQVRKQFKVFSQFTQSKSAAKQSTSNQRNNQFNNDKGSHNQIIDVEAEEK